MATKKKRHKFQKSSYPSLKAVYREILEKGIEKVVDFNGYEIITDRGKYGLYDGQVTIYDD